MIQEYVAGFMHDDKRLALVKKNRPEWQSGLLNGIGGKVEEYDASPYEAMTREFEEEAGLFVEGWDNFLTLRGTQSLIHCFAFYDQLGLLDKVKTMEDEPIVVVNTGLLIGGFYDTVPNVRWIVPLMLQRENYHPVEVKFYSGTRGTKVG